MLYFIILLRWLTISFAGAVLKTQILVVLVGCWCALLSIFYTYYFYDIFPSHNVIISQVLLGNCCTVLLSPVSSSKTQVKLVLIIAQFC
jgi:hypothetical protein